MGRRDAKRERMQGLVRQWRASGEPLSRFARRHGLSENVLRYWSERVGGTQGPPRGKAAPAFTPVRLVGDGAAIEAAALEIRLTSGDVIRAGQELPAERLASVIRVLRERC